LGNREIAPRMEDNVIRPIYKEGDILNYANYHGITFLKTAYDVHQYFTSRSKVYAEELTGDHQSGFHRERSASRNIFYMLQTAAKCCKCHIPL